MLASIRCALLVDALGGFAAFDVVAPAAALVLLGTSILFFRDLIIEGLMAAEYNSAVRKNRGNLNTIA
ncbi:MAG: hypothetical protein AAFO94_04350 [Bacteroidota bacterium]